MAPFEPRFRWFCKDVQALRGSFQEPYPVYDAPKEVKPKNSENRRGVRSGAVSGTIRGGMSAGASTLLGRARWR